MTANICVALYDWKHQRRERHLYFATKRIPVIQILYSTNIYAKPRRVQHVFMIVY